MTRDDMLIGDHTLYVKDDGKWTRRVWVEGWSEPEDVADEVAHYLEKMRNYPQATPYPTPNGTQVLYSKNGDVE